MRKHLYRHALQTALLLFIAVQSQATDLTPTALVSPRQTPVKKVSVPVQFVVANQNIQVADDYTIDVTIRNASNQLLLSEVVTGKRILPLTNVMHTAINTWTPSDTGRYTIRVAIAFAQDIDTTNNVKIFTVRVVPASYTLSMFDEQTNDADTVNAQDCRVEYISNASSVWQFLNLGYVTGSTIQWVLQNMPLPPRDFFYVYHTLINLPIVGVHPPQIVIVPYLTTQPLDSFPIDLSDTVRIDYGKVRVNIGDKGLQDTSKITVIDFVPPPTVPTTAPITEAAIRSCDVPNIDLDSATYNATTVPGYAGDMNACAPTACANSMQWLEKHFPINTGLSHRQKLVELSKLMGRENNTGVWSEDFIRAKLDYINKYNLPIKVKFQLRGLTNDIATSPESDYESSASNQIEGAYPKWEWLKKEMHDSEDVEMFVEYHDRSGDTSIVSGRHVITASGVAEAAGQHRFWYKDDADQAKAGGTREVANEWRLRGGTIPIIDHVDWSPTTSRTTVVYGVISESYDSTVRRKEKGFFEKLRDRTVGWAPRYEHDEAVDWVKSHPIRFGNMYTRLRDGVYQPNEWRWVLRNHPIGGVFDGGTSTILSHYTLGIDTTRFPDPIEVRILYTDEPVKEQPPNIGPGILYPVPPTIGNYAQGSPNLTTIEPPPTTHKFLEYPPVDGLPFKVDTAIIHKDVPGADVSANDTAMVGESFILHAAAAMSWLGAHAPEVNLNRSNSTLRKEIAERLQFLAPNSQSPQIEALLRETQSGYMQMRPSFQSFRLPDEDIVISSIPEGPVYHAKNVSVDRKIEWTWLRDRLKRFGPMPVEIGYYNADKRTHGTWALIIGVVEHNGLKRLIMNVDMEEDAPGGQEKLVHTVQTYNGYHYLVEQSSNVSRAYIETVLSLEYDPSMVDVKAQPLTEVYNLRVVPQPSDDVVSVSWQQAYTAGATISVIDLLGVERLRADVPNDGSATWTTSTSMLSNGRYTIVISTTLGRTSIPLIVIHE